MPADNIIVGLRPGHIDTKSGVVPAVTALSVEVKQVAGALVTVLHIDVAMGETVDQPFSVGIPLAPTDIVTVVTALTHAGITADSQGARDLLN